MLLTLHNTLIGGAILSLLASAYLLGMLLINPRLLLQDYPQDIRAAVPPKTVQERRLSLLLGLPFLLLLVAFPLSSSLTLKSEMGSDVTFGLLLLNSFGILFFFNLVDWLILDWLIFCTITPHFLVIPGTEGMAAYKNLVVHFRGFLIGTAFSAVGGLLISLIAWFA
jgi:hypothetical protein